ncbi:MAG TPA: DUF2752 domain-containing protein [Acidobacteriota bacterium]
MRLQNREIKADQLRLGLFFGGAVFVLMVADTNGQYVNLWGHPLPALCFFQRFVGFDCPGCGITRSLIFAFDGRFTQSYFQHLWGLPLALLLLMQIPAKLMAAFSMPNPVPIPLRGKWWNHFVFLSLLLPWTAKTAAVLYIQIW